MNLSELQENKKSKMATKVLRENFNFDIDLRRMNIKTSTAMLKKVRNLVTEAKQSTTVHTSHRDPGYLKLLMLEQALSGHIQELRASTRIVVENEEVQKSQVVLAAQDMIDSVQKMIEQVSKMSVEELNAVVEGIKNLPDFGVNESEQVNTSATQAMSQLLEALKTAKSGISQAFSGVIGDGEMAGAPPQEMPGEESSELPDDFSSAPGDEMGSELPELPEEPEEEQPMNTGRERR
jgi:hypothetical protein